MSRPPTSRTGYPERPSVPRPVRRLYALLLLAYPRRTRRRFGPQMQSLFEDCWLEARNASGRLARLRLWFRTVRDVAVNATLIRLGATGHGSGDGRLRRQPPDARRSARSSAGDRVRRVAAAQAATGGARRDGREGSPGGSTLDHLLQDVRHTLRSLRVAPGFATAVIGTLALGIGAGTATFSVVDGVLLEGLPFPEADRIVRIWTCLPEADVDTFPLSNAEFLDYRAESELYEEVAAWASASLVVTGGERPERLAGVAVNAGFWEVMGVPAALGHTFGSAEDGPGGSDVAVLSHRLWHQRFGADPGIVGDTIDLEDSVVTVLGVMPADFRFPASGTDLWVPLGLDPAAVARRDGHYLMGVGRLLPDVAIERVQAEMDLIFRRWDAEYEHAHPFRAVPLREQMVGAVRQPLLMLLGAVSLVLLVACTNVAGLLLARAGTRRREIGVRTALGASRRRILAQLLTESVALAMAGGAAGLLLAYWGVDLLLALEPGNLPRLEEIGVDGRVLGFTLAVSLLTGVAFGLAPALETARRDLTRALSAGGRGGTAARGRPRQVLVATEVAAAVVLLVAAGLLLRSFSSLSRTDPGLAPDNLLTARVTPSAPRYRSAEATQAFFEGLVERLEQLPGVESAALVRSLPYWDSPFLENFSRWEADPTDPNAHVSVDFQVATPGYFRTMGIPIVAGREFTDADRASSGRVTVVSRHAADAYFADGEAVGRLIRLHPGDPSDVPVEIVGIADDVGHMGLGTPPRAQVFVPLDQVLGYAQWAARSLAPVVRTTVPAGSVADGLRRAVWSIDPELPVSSVQTMHEVLAASLARQRFVAALLTAFAVVALALAGVGLHGLLAFGVAERGGELALHMALGARPASVRSRVVREGMLLVGAGLVVGLVASWAAGGLLGAMLFGIAPGDPLAHAGAVAFLLATTLAATWLPARRATRVDPMQLLRSD